MPPLTGKPKQQRFTNQSGIMTSISSKLRSATSGRPSLERTDFGYAVCSYKQTLHLGPSQPHYGL